MADLIVGLIKSALESAFCSSLKKLEGVQQNSQLLMNSIGENP